MQTHDSKQQQQMKEREHSRKKEIDEGPVLDENIFQELPMDILDNRT